MDTGPIILLYEGEGKDWGEARSSVGHKARCPRTGVGMIRGPCPRYSSFPSRYLCFSKANRCEISVRDSSGVEVVFLDSRLDSLWRS